MIPMMDARSGLVAGRPSTRAVWPSIPGCSSALPGGLPAQPGTSCRDRRPTGPAGCAAATAGTAWAGRRAAGPDMIDARSRDVELPGGGRLFVHELAGPPGAATVVLLHGWGGTAAGNWSTAMPALARDFRVVAPDLRGTTPGSVDDVIELLDALGIERCIAVGYSLGSAVAAQLARRQSRPGRRGGPVCRRRGVGTPPAGAPGDAFDLPTAVVVTRQDRLIPAWRQVELARSIPGATVHTVNGNHFAFARSDVFVPALLQACHSVIRRAGERDIGV